MRKFYTILFALLAFAGIVSAQTPKGFNYQAVVRNSAGQLMTNRNVGVRITIAQGATNGNAVYTQTEIVRTNANGLFTIQVGDDSDQFAAIDWSNGPYFIISEVDHLGGTNYTLTTSQKILAVPYAHYATVAERLVGSFVYNETDPLFRNWAYSYDSLQGAPTRLSQFINDLDFLTAADLALTLNGDTLFINGGSYVVLPINRRGTIEWDSVLNHPVRLSQFINDLNLTVRGDTLFLGDSTYVTLPTSIEWDSVRNHPVRLSQFINDLAINPTVSISGDTIFIGNSYVVLPDNNITTIEWDSVLNHPVRLSQFINDLAINPTVSISGDTIFIGNSYVILPTTIEWDSVLNHPVRLSQFINDLNISISGDTLIFGDSLRVTLPTTIEWDSVLNHPVRLSQFVNDLDINPTVSISGDTIFIGNSYVTLPTTIEWDSVLNRPVRLSQFINDLNISISGDTLIFGDSIRITLPTTIEWDSVLNHPVRLSQFINDLNLTVSGDTLIFGDSLRVTLPTTIEWDSVLNHPVRLSQFVNDLNLTVSGDTLIFGDSLRVTLPTTIEWDSVLNHPVLLSQFVNDLDINPTVSISGDTIFIGNSYVTLPTTIEWDSVLNHPVRLSQFINDLNFTLSGDTLFLGDNLYVTLPTTISWDSVIGHPTNLSQFTNDLGFLTTETQGLADVIAINNNANGQIKNLSRPTDSLDAVNKVYVDSLVASEVAVLNARIDSLNNRIDSLTNVYNLRFDSVNNIMNELQHPLMTGELPGKFSVSGTKQVRFSKGNLQYRPRIKTWRFASNQYNVCGSDNNNIYMQAYCSAWIDLFGYGTSGWDGGAGRYMPYETTTNDSEYTEGTDGDDLIGFYANADWGFFNNIINGGNQTGLWRTLTYSEWSYLLTTRTNAAQLKGMATVEGIPGYILLPDDWQSPAGVTFSTVDTSFSVNVYNSATWVLMETAGAVFLPAAGSRTGSVTSGIGTIGKYWTASHVNGTTGYSFQIAPNNNMMQNSTRYSTGCSVRLVRDY